MLKFKIPDLNDFVIRCVIEDAVYLFHFAWNDRGQYWAFDIQDAQKNTLMGRVKCVPNYPVLRQFRNPNLPSGEIVFLMADKTASTIGRDDFKNNKAEFLYLTAAEVAAYAI